MKHAVRVSVLLAAALVSLALLVAGCGEPERAIAGSPRPAAVSATPASQVSAAPAPEGQSLFAAAGCSGCHRVGDSGGVSGPDLSHEGSAHTAEWIVEQVRDPRTHNPNGMMPPYGRDRLSDAELKALAAYLASQR